MSVRKLFPGHGIKLVLGVHGHLARVQFVASKCVLRMNSYLMNFGRRLVLATAIAGVVAVTSPGATPRPNAVFIAIDDLNDWVGCLGGYPDVKTPVAANSFTPAFKGGSRTPSTFRSVERGIQASHQRKTEAARACTAACR